METIHVWPQESIEKDGGKELSCLVEGPQGDRTRLWYRFGLTNGIIPSERADPYAIALIFPAMAHRAKLHIHGAVCPALLRNLEEYSTIWSRWRPNTYAPVLLEADEESVAPIAPEDVYLAAFSGGVDAAFTVYRHVSNRCGRQRRKISTAALVHGFDIPLSNPKAFARVLEKAQHTLSSIGVRTLSVATNWRNFPVDWEDGHASALISCLSFCSTQARGALLGSSNPYEILVDYGSTPLVDPKLSSAVFQVVHDGAAFSRTEKIALLSEWEQACQNLHVCWEGEQHDRNCCSCEKCVRTILNFRAVTGSLPACFEQDVSDEVITHLKFENVRLYNEYVSIVRFAEVVGRGGEHWVSLLKSRLRDYDKHHGAKLPIIPRLALARKVTSKLKICARFRALVREGTLRLGDIHMNDVDVAKPKDRTDDPEITQTLRAIITYSRSRACRRHAADIEGDKARLVAKLGTTPAEPHPLLSIHYRTEAEAVMGRSATRIGGELLYSIVRTLKPTCCIEIGSDYGYGTAYIGRALRDNGHGRLRSLEDWDARGRVARETVERLGVQHHVEIVAGSMPATLSTFIASLGTVDFVYSNGGRISNLTLSRFHEYLAGMPNGGHMLFDDIRHNCEVQEIFRQIVADQRVTHCITFYNRFGLLRISPA